MFPPHIITKFVTAREYKETPVELMATAQECKDLAAAAWSNGQYDVAIEHYTTAISLAAVDTNEKDMLKTLSSNRSAAYMKCVTTHSRLYSLYNIVNIQSWSNSSSINRRH